MSLTMNAELLLPFILIITDRAGKKQWTGAFKTVKDARAEAMTWKGCTFRLYDLRNAPQLTADGFAA